VATVNLEVDRKLFNPVYLPYLEDETRTQIFFGGSSSGKSYFLAQRAVLEVAAGGHNYLVVRKVAGTLRRSSYNEITKAIRFFKLSDYFACNKSDLMITCKNGYQILFCGMDDPEKVKSITPAKGVITDIWYEEATEAEYEDVKQLEKRLRGMSKVKKRILLSFNPVYKTHWIFSEYFEGRWDDSKRECRDETVSILKTTYRDNKFLTADDVKALEEEKDKYYKDVYSDGNWGVLGKVIFTNWSTADLSGLEQRVHTFQNGIDFGFAADPTAVVHLHYDRDTYTLYVLNAQYYFQLTNDLLAGVASNMFGKQIAVCDCASPLNIQELRQHGLTAIPCTKGKDSVNFGIQWLQQQRIVIHHTLREAINEFTVYKWREDKEGKVLPEPIDRDNHIIDAIRYAMGDVMAEDRRMKSNEMHFANGGKRYDPLDRRR